MRPTTIRKLIELVEESQIEALEVTSWWRKVKITRKHSQHNGSTPGAAAVDRTQSAEQQIVVAQQQAAAPPPQAVTQVSAPAEAQSNLVEITSPMVGTYYAAPSPDSPEFVKVGDSIDVGTVVCIVEAMKLMNEIESERKGTIKKILVENAQPVEFGQALFLIDPS